MTEICYNIEQMMSKMSQKQIDIISPLNDQQKIAAVNYKGPVVVEAIPGSGKTALSVARAAYMIEDGVSPSSILMFSFTKKAANEIRERLEKKIGVVAKQITTCTFHSFCSRFLRKYIQTIGLKQNFSIYDDEDKQKVIKEVMNKFNNADEIDLYTWSNTISRYKDQYLTPKQAMAQAVEEYDERGKRSAEFYAEYQKTLMRSNALDFDDLLLYTVYILQHNDSIKENLHRKYRYCIADENQDSSYIDSLFIKEIVSKEKNIALLGDTDQAIYGFRGSSPDNLKRLAEYFGAAILHLDTNYRSTQTIVNAGKSLIDHNSYLFEEKHPTTKNEKGSDVYHVIYKDQNQEATRTAHMIDAFTNMEDKDGNKMQYSDIAVLVRASYLTRIFEDAFIKYNIPYTIVSGHSFYDRLEIKDIVSYLKYIYNPRDFVSLSRIINIPKKRIGDVSQKKIVDYLVQEMAKYATISVSDVIILLKKYADSKSGLFASGLNIFIKHLNEIYNFIKINEGAPDKIIDKIISVVDYKGYISKHHYEEYDDKISNLNELISIAKGFISITEFLDSFMLNSDAVAAGEDKTPNKVQMMTMHGSKGLEFNTVFLPSCNEGIIPHAKSVSTIEGIQEERRLMYVAMTRAEKHLIISNVKEMVRYGRPVPSAQSMFIGEIDSQYVTEKDYSHTQK